VGAAVDAAEAGAAAEGVNDGLTSFLTAEVPFATEAAGAAEVAEATGSADSAVLVFRSASEVLSPVDRPFPLPTVSAGSGAVVLDPASAVSSLAVAATSAVAASPEAEESPSARPARCDAPERDLPVPVRDGDMTPLSTIVSAASPSGSAFRLGGAMMSGG
jgi:hypothetical protein